MSAPTFRYLGAGHGIHANRLSDADRAALARRLAETLADHNAGRHPADRAEVLPADHRSVLQVTLPYAIGCSRLDLRASELAEIDAMIHDATTAPAPHRLDEVCDVARRQVQR
jgi:hypothetical protein